MLRRTLQRRLRHEELWHGNYEPPLHSVLTDKEHILRWHRHSFDSNRRRYAEVVRGGAAHRLMVVALRSQSEADRWLAGRVTMSGCSPTG